MEAKIDAEKTWIRSVVIPGMLKAKNAADTPYEIYDIVVKFIGPEEAFMLTSCYRAMIDFKYNGQRKKRNVVVKKTPPLPVEIYDSINFKTLFNNEILTYTKIMPAIEQFTGKRFEVPKYYYSELQRSFATIVLGDFGDSGWRVSKTKYNLSLPHVLSAVKYLGNFHGIGFAMRDTKREEFDAMTSKLKESRFQSERNELFELSLKFSAQRILKVTPKYAPMVEEKSLQQLVKQWSDYRAFGLSCVKPVEPYVTLCHGDFLRNNIAFRYEENGGAETPTETIMFDLQTMRVCSPMVDLTVILMLSAFAEVRAKNFELIFESYRQSLIKAYEEYAKQSPPAHFSYDALVKEFIRLMPYGLNIASFFLRLIVDPPPVTSEDFLQNEQPVEEIEAEVMTGGGEIVDRELAHQVQEMYKLSQKYAVKIGEGLNS